VGELVGQHALQLLFVEDAHDPFGHGHGGVLGVSPGGEGIGLLGRDEVHARHRHAGLTGQPPHDAVEPGGLGLADRLGTIHRQHDLVGPPVAGEVHRQREHEGDHHALTPAEGTAEQDEHGGQDRQQQRGLENVGHTWPLPWERGRM
jgi:hypothetical protein